ncbi:O-antigen ligase family protein [Streptomyces sp. NPDC060286]|uniref:O-antigen ligase family protein n=1 Tax=unclassified Streptomyces TaxID=2593676 RepID=UPI0035E215AC
MILAACAIWSLISAAGRETGPEGVLLALLAVAAGFACGRICGTLLPVATATVAAVAALLLGLLSRHGVPGATATTDTAPGHAGAAAALLVLAAGAACCAAAASRQAPLRFALRLLALGAACAALTLRSVAGFAAAVGVLLCSLAAARMRALATGLVVATSWAVAADALPQGLKVSLEGPLTAHRVQLWQDALELAGEHPVQGIGPGRFAALSPTVEQTVHSDGKPHSAPLQQAAEQGVTGVVLLGSSFGWLLYVLWHSPRSTAVVLTAGTTLTALAVLASVGNALSLTPVTAGAGLLAGLASARSPIGENTAGAGGTADDGEDRTHGTHEPDGVGTGR